MCFVGPDWKTWQKNQNPRPSRCAPENNMGRPAPVEMCPRENKIARLFKIRPKL